MKIALIASRLHTGGGKIFGLDIIKEVSKQAHGHQILAVVPNSPDYLSQLDADNLELLVCPRQSEFRRGFWVRKVLLPALTDFQPDWVWSLENYPIPGIWNQSLLVQDAHLLFDETWFKEESFYNKLKKRFGRFLLRRRRHLPHRYYCQTDVIAQRLAKQLGIAEEKIGLCPPNVEWNGEAEPSDYSQGLQDVVKDRRLVLFYPARCYSHKNHQVILDAYCKFRRELEDTICFWTIEHGQHAIAGDILDSIANENLGNLIYNLGSLSQEQVRSVFSLSDVLLMPTKLETFGIPFVEAMHSGVAIISSDFDFTRAVCGEAAFYLRDADSPEAVRDAIIALRDNSSQRDQLVNQGRKRVQSMPSLKTTIRNILRQENIPV